MNHTYNFDSRVFHCEIYLIISILLFGNEGCTVAHLASGTLTKVFVNAIASSFISRVCESLRLREFSSVYTFELVFLTLSLSDSIYGDTGDNGLPCWIKFKVSSQLSLCSWKIIPPVFSN